MANRITTLLGRGKKPVAALPVWGARERDVARMQERAAAVDPAVVLQEWPELFAQWQAGDLQPRRLTMALDAVHAEGTWVDVACGAEEPEVTLWEAGQLYPSWENTVRLAALTGTPLMELLSREDLGPDESFARCGNAVFGKELRAGYLPALVELTVAAYPDRASLPAAAAVVKDAFMERFKFLME